jgi:putative adhesin
VHTSFSMHFKIALLLALTASTAWALSEERLNEEYDIAPGGQLIVDVDFGTIEVSTGDDSKVSLEAYRKIDCGNEAREKAYLASAPILVTQDGNTLQVRVRREREHNGWNWTGNVNMDARYTLRVPKTFNADLRTSGGSITADGLTGEVKADTSGGKLKFAHLVGALDARTSGGGISLDACNGPLKIATSGGSIECNNGSGSLDARTSGGSIDVRGFAGDTEVKTSGGKLTLENIKGEIAAKTSAGSIEAVLIDPVPGDVLLQTSAGSIDVALSAKAAVSVEAKSSLGKIRTEIPMLATKSDDDQLEGTLNGGGKLLTLKASVGSITIHPTEGATIGR